MRTGLSIGAAAMLAAGSGQAAAAPAAFGGWSVSAKRSQIDGGTSAAAVLRSSNRVANVIGSPEAAALVIRCNGEAVVAYVAWPTVLGVRDIEIRYRIDAGPAKGGYWPPSDTGDAVGQWDTVRARAWLAEFGSSAARLVFAATPYGKTEDEAVFDLAGMPAALAAATAACAGGDLPESAPTSTAPAPAASDPPKPAPGGHRRPAPQ